MLLRTLGITLNMPFSGVSSFTASRVTVKLSAPILCLKRSCAAASPDAAQTPDAPPARRQAVTQKKNAIRKRAKSDFRKTITIHPQVVGK
jgi:hypothetical protein